MRGDSEKKIKSKKKTLKLRCARQD